MKLFLEESLWIDFGTDPDLDPGSIFPLFHH